MFGLKMIIFMNEDDNKTNSRTNRCRQVYFPMKRRKLFNSKRLSLLIQGPIIICYNKQKKTNSLHSQETQQEKETSKNNMHSHQIIWFPPNNYKIYTYKQHTTL